MNLVILDFSKAFDRVPRRRLLENLNHYYGISGQTQGWIHSFLSGRTQQVIEDGATSEKVPVISGVLKSTVLGPLLFLLFINDLPDCVTSRTRLFVTSIALHDVNQHGVCPSTRINANVLRVADKRTPFNSTYKLKGQELAELSTSEYFRQPGLERAHRLDSKESEQCFGFSG